MLHLVLQLVFHVECVTSCVTVSVTFMGYDVTKFNLLLCDNLANKGGMRNGRRSGRNKLDLRIIWKE